MQENKVEEVDLVACIVNRSEGDQTIQLAAAKGVKTGTVLLGRGTARKGILRALGLDEVKKEIVLFIAPADIAKEAMNFIVEKKKMKKKSRGISFRLPLEEVLGTLSFKKENKQSEEMEVMHQAIFVIVDHGEAETVMDAAEAAGARGGTIIHAHGAGQHQTKKVFNLEIEPEKEIVLIISETENIDAIKTSISEEIHLDQPNTGILFVANLSETRGII